MRGNLDKGIKKNFRFLSIIIVIAIILGFNYNYKTIKEASAASQSKPSFTIDNVTLNPEKPKVGEDITVTGTITPNDFTMDVPENDIVLVLDVSGSMNDNIEIQCTNERVRKWIPSWFGGYWVDDYCEEHKVSGNHTYKSSKLNELKKAANNFIDKMKDVPNLKIGIVAYSSKAWVNPNGYNGNTTTNSLGYGRHDVPNYSLEGNSLLDINNPNLINMIDNLKGLGGTNTGEGIRKGIALLDSGGSNAKKTLVLMSDGLPTFYSVNGTSYDEYTNIDFTDPNYRGNGSNDDNGDNLQYAKTIGSKVKEKSYNAFTIGYGLNNDGNNKMKQIHNSMTGINLSNSTDENYNEEKGFFETSDGAIDGVFNTIADKILKEYTIDNGVFTDTMIDGFNLTIGSNTVSIPSMVYKSDGISKDGKLTYTCEPYNFSFIITASKSGVFENVFNNSKISFPWNGETIDCQMPVKKLEVEDNSLPKIQAILDSEKNITVKPNEDAEVRYKIDAESFQYGDIGNQSRKKDVVILVDTSSSISSALTQLKNAGFGKLVNDPQLTTLKTKYCIITYDSTATIKNPKYNPKDPNFKDYDGDTENLKQDVSALDNSIIKNISATNSSERNIGQALKKAYSVLGEDDDDFDKYILMISSGNVKYESEDIQDYIGKSNIKFLSLAISSQNGDNPQEFLYDIHEKLAGEKSADLSNNGGNYFICRDNNDITNNIMPAIAEKIKSSNIKKDYEFDVSLVFDIGDDIIITDGTIPDKYGKFNINVRVNYQYDDVAKEFRAKQSDNIVFRIKPKGVGKTCEFGQDNVLSYEGLVNTFNKNITTPTITCIADDLHHGIYEGKDSNGKYNIYESDNEGTLRNYSPNSIINFGIKTQIYSDDKLTLKIGDQADLQDKIYIYEIINDRLNLINDIDTEHDKKEYSIEINNGDNQYSAERNILIRYTCKIKDNSSGKLTNTITNQYKTSKDINITISGDDLPELF